jgi:trans-2,3-dihydro-3-hydroxyanthranilate isomerase
MKPPVFYFVDVFADRPLTGNPVVIVPDADDLTEAQMAALAREFNQSETTFLLRPGIPGADRRLRSFTPIGAEVFGAGHNALGAWLWLAASGRLPAGRTDFRQQIGNDLLPVRVEGATVSMDQSPPRFGARVTNRAALAAALALEADDVADAQVVSTGAAHLLVPVGTRAAVDRAAPDSHRLTPLLSGAGAEGCYLYSLEADLPYARFFNPTMGIPEDPATGTAAGPLAALLVHRGLRPAGTLDIAQGHRLGRPSRIQVTVDGSHVTVSGTGLVVAEGTLHL